MRSAMAPHLVVSAFLVLTTSPLAAQATLTGIVREDSSARPLEGVEVLINGTSHRAMTGANGRYLLEGLPAGIYQAIFRAVGHIPVRMDVLLTAGETTRANATLVRSDVVLDPIVVTGEPVREVGLAGRGFEERRKMGFGRFVDPEEMRRSEHLRLADVLRRHQVEIKPIGNMNSLYAVGTARGTPGGVYNCLMSIWIDGTLILPGGIIGELEKPLDLYDLRRVLEPAALVAAEIYRRDSEMPLQFGGRRSPCGAIVLWTRRGP